MPPRKKATAAPWPLGEWLRTHRGAMSVREAARRADISEGRWRQVELGFQRMAGGIEVPVHPRPETTAAMARAVGGDPAEALRLAGHNPDQYAHLVENPAEQLAEGDRDWFTGLPRDEREQVLTELQRLHLETELRNAEHTRSGGKRTAT